MNDTLPIHAVLPDLLDALRRNTGAVLVAPPGAGKTTAVAPALLGEAWCDGTIILTSPRRVAARAAAERMADLLGERAGETVGYLTRLDTKRGANTRILVVTEAIFVNMILDDPDLAGVSAILFDEAHERHLDGDLGLALALETQAVLREDLRVLVMSATIDGARFAELLGAEAPVIESEGRAWPLRLEWLGASPQSRIEDAMTSAIATAWRNEAGDLLAFLPGVREIERVRERLAQRLPSALVLPLHGQVRPEEQRAAIGRDPQGRRRIVLATAIAQTSLTLDGVSVVVDSGLSRHALFDRTAGTTHLLTQRASQAASAQRAGRAARQGPGAAYRLWEEAAHPGRPPFDPPEIETADLAPLVLSLARWGTGDPGSLAWLDPPPAASLAAARKMLRKLGALDGEGRITPLGEAIGTLPLDPIGAATVLYGAAAGAGPEAAKLVLLLQERGLGGHGEDLLARLQRWDGDRSARATASRKLAERWAKAAQHRLSAHPDLVEELHPGSDQTAHSEDSATRTATRMEWGNPATALALARPDFVAKRRDAVGENWLSAGGRGFFLDPTSSLARAEFLVIGDAQGQAKGARITAAAALEAEDVERWLESRIETCSILRWTGERVEARRERRLGAIVLAKGPDPEPDPEEIVNILVEKAADNLSKIVPCDLLARGAFAGLDDISEARLRDTTGLWLRPLLDGRRDLAVSRPHIVEAILGMLDWNARQALDTKAPREFISPAGTHHAIDYAADDAPSVEVRVQALFGLDRHPLIGAGTTQAPLLLKLTSPAGRPLQSTADLPGFWRGSWKDVRKDMKGRYPKHRWPEEPWTEAPSLKIKNAFARGQS